ncbi:hypothetical protein BD769DRAFT_1473751, partial [Suillus cothurnatus]
GVIPATPSTYIFHFYSILTISHYAQLGILLVQLLYAILGLYSWEYIRSSHVEIALIRRQLPFRWPLLSYITARSSFFVSIVLHATQSSPFYTSVDCQSECFFLTNVAIGCSTTNLMIRTHAHIYLLHHAQSHDIYSGG